MKIEKVKAEDAGELLAIYAPYVTETAVSFEYDVPSESEFRDRILKISSKYPYIKAVDNNEILGYAYAACFKDRKAYDYSVEVTVYVKQDRRKAGVGRMLYNALEASLKAMGILNLNACIAVPKGEDEYLSYDSFRFHEKMGFKLVGTFHDSGFKFNKWYDMIWMEKMIGEHCENPKEICFGEWDVKE